MLKGENYCITAENIRAHEMIGLNAKVIGSAERSRIGLSGKIVDETRNTFVIESHGVEKIVPKAEAVFEFELGKEKVKVDGKDILYRPEARTKALWRNMNA
ncbi:MAG: ribonuclease P protein component 1 [archaeon]